MKELIELGPQQFSENLRWLLCEWGINKNTLARRAFSRKHENSGRRKIDRMQSGFTALKIRDIEAIANVFDIPPAVLTYGTKEQLKRSWSTRHRRRE